MQPQVHLGVHDLVDLGLGGRHYAGMGVAGVEHADAGGEVEEGAAAGCVDGGAAAMGKGEVG